MVISEKISHLSNRSMGKVLLDCNKVLAIDLEQVVVDGFVSFGPDLTCFGV
jgi:hypothetical protein